MASGIILPAAKKATKPPMARRATMAMIALAFLKEDLDLTRELLPPVYSKLVAGEFSRALTSSINIL